MNYGCFHALLPVYGFGGIASKTLSISTEKTPFETLEPFEALSRGSAAWFWEILLQY